VKLSLGVIFTNISIESSSNESVLSSFYVLTVCVGYFFGNEIGPKATHNMQPLLILPRINKQLFHVKVFV